MDGPLSAAGNCPACGKGPRSFSRRSRPFSPGQPGALAASGRAALAKAGPFAYKTFRHGAWRSMVAHLLWEQGVAGSNPVAPTRITQKDSSTAGVLFFCPSFSPSPLSASFRASLQAPFPAASYPCGPIAIPRTAAHASASLPPPARHLTPLIETIIVSPRCASYALGNDT